MQPSITVYLSSLLLFLLSLDSAFAAPATIAINGYQAAPNRLIVKWKDGIAPPASLSQALAQSKSRDPTLKALAARAQLGKTYRKLPGIAVLELPRALASGPQSAARASAELKNRIAALKASNLFEYVEPDYLVHANIEPGDRAYRDGSLWGLRNTSANGGVAGIDIDAAAAWDITTGSEQVIVGVIDTGVRYTHRELSANMWRNPGEIPGNGRDDDHDGYVDDVYGINAITGSGNPMDDNNHGSHVSGTIGAAANSGGAHVGVAWKVRIMALKFLDANGSGYDSDAIECIDYAIAKGAKILSNSWGGGGYSAATRDAIERARRADILFVAAAGNDARDTDVAPTYPADYEAANIVSVAAIDHRGVAATFSNYGMHSVDLAAPGVAIYSTTANSDTSYASFSGTSMATPHVSGVAALLAARYPHLTATEMKQRLLTSVTPLPGLAGRSVSGGLLNAARALRASADGTLEINAEVSPRPLRAGGSATVAATVSDLAPVTAAIVSAHFDNEVEVALHDDGNAPDSSANDGIYSAELPVGANGATASLTVAAAAPGKLATIRYFDFAVATPPVNDDFVDRSVVPVGNVQAAGTTIDASAEAGEPRDPAVAGGKSVWWSWTAASTGNVTINTAGSDFDTTLAVYRGSALNSLTLLGANDDGGGVQSVVNFNATAGVTYLLRVDGFLNAEGHVVLRFPAAGGALGAPRINTEPLDAVVPAGAEIALSVVALGEGITYQWYKDGALLNGANAASYHKIAADAADAGAYQVRVSNADGLAISRSATIRIGARATNDDFDAALALSGNGQVQGSTLLASGEPAEPNHAAVSAPLSSVWYRWTAPADGLLTLDTFGSDFDTTLAAYSGETVARLTLISADDDAANNTQSRVRFAVHANQTYRIAVDGFAASAGHVVLNYAFVASSDTVLNDDFVDAKIFTGRTTIGSNVGASGENGEPNHAARSAPLASAWWRWTAPRDGRFEFDTTGSDFDTTLAIYLGNRVDHLRQLAANDDFDDRSSRVVINALAGRSYLIAVDGYNDAQGHIALHQRQRLERPDVFARYEHTIGRHAFLPSRQLLESKLTRGGVRVVRLYVQNTGTTARQYQIKLSGNLSTHRVVTSLRGASGDLTFQARLGALRTPVLQPRQYAVYSLQVNTGHALLPKNYRIEAALEATDTRNSGIKDMTRVRLRVP